MRLLSSVDAPEGRARTLTYRPAGRRLGLRVRNGKGGDSVDARSTVTSYNTDFPGISPPIWSEPVLPTPLRGRQAALVILGVVLLLATASGGVAAQSAGYHDFDALTAELQTLVDSSDAAQMRSLGTSVEGRDIWLVQLAADGPAPVASRPAVLVVGNLEGDHVVGSELALGVVRYLLSGAEGTEAVLNEQVVYVVPRLNPDAAEAMFAAVQYNRRGNTRPYDDDSDGRIDEDPAEDLNGDGVITMMRVLDPEGTYVMDEDEPRIMKAADATEGESGAYSIYWEGVDSDGDGFYNEDGVGGVDLNRNFQHAYPYFKADAGRHMVSESETRALVDFAVANRNIAAILTFGHSDNLVTDYDGQGNPGGLASLDLVAQADASNADVYDAGVFGQGGGFGRGFGFGFFFGGGGGGGGLALRGAQVGADNDPSSGRRPETTFNENDRAYFKAISDAYKATAGLEAIGLNRGAEGAFFQYGYFQYGVPSFSTPGWAPPAASGDDAEATEDTESPGPPAGAMARRGGGGGQRGGRGGGGRGGFGGGAAAAGSGSGSGSGGDAALLARLEADGIDAFVDWTPFEHPQLGAVEIGGFRPYVTHNPPAESLEELGRKHGEFVVDLVAKLPRVKFVSTEVTNHGGGVFTVTAEIANSGFFPTALRQGITARAVQSTMVQIQVDPDNVLTGDAKTSTVPRLEGSGGRASFSWVIRGAEGDDVEIRVRSQKGGSDSVTVTLR